MGYLNNLMKNSIFIIILVSFTAFLGYFIRILYARTFSSLEFGFIYSVIGVFGLISVFNDFGFSESLSYYGTKFIVRKDMNSLKSIFYYALILQMSMSLIISLLVYLFSDLILVNFFKIDTDVIVLTSFIFYFIFLNATRPYINILFANRGYYHSNLSEFIRVFFIASFSILLFYFEILDLVHVGYVWSFSLFLLFIVYFILVKINFNFSVAKFFFDLELLKKVLKYSWFVVLSTGIFMVFGRVDVLLITFFHGSEMVGFYTIALSIVTVITALFNPLLSMIFPLSAELMELNKKDLLTEIVAYVINITMVVVLPIAITLFLFSKEITILLFGNKYLSASFAIPILVVGYIFQVFIIIIFKLMAGLNILESRSKVILVGFFTNLVVDLFLIPYLGFVGAAIGTSLSLILIFILGYNVISKQLILNIDLNKIKCLVIINFIIAGVIYFLKGIFNYNYYFEAVIILVISGSLYFFFIYYFKILDFKFLFNKFRGLLK